VPKLKRGMDLNVGEEEQPPRGAIEAASIDRRRGNLFSGNII